MTRITKGNKILKLFILMSLIILLILISLPSSFAKDCGNTAGDGSTRVECACLDTIITDYTMQSDIFCGSSSAFKIGANNIVVDCQNHELKSIDSRDKTYAGFKMDTMTGVTIKNCRINGFGPGIIARYEANNNRFDNLWINASYYYCGLYFYQSSNNIVTNSDFTPGDGCGIWLNAYYSGKQSSNNHFENITVGFATEESVAIGYLYSTGICQNNTFVNATYINETMYKTNPELIRQWFYQAYVHDSQSPIVGATVEIYDQYNNLIDTLTTGSDGKTPRITLIEYTNTTAGMMNYSSPYTITASKSGKQNSTHIINLDNNLINDTIFLNNIPAQAGTCGDTAGIGGEKVICNCKNTIVTDYTMEDDIFCGSSSAFKIGANDIVVDCQEHELKSIDSRDKTYAGFYLDTKSGVTIKNCRINGFGPGIIARYEANNNRFDNLWINASYYYCGLYFYQSSNNIVTNSDFTPGDGCGIWLNAYYSGKQSSNNHFENITVGFATEESVAVGYLYSTGICQNNTFVNATYINETMYKTNPELIRQWFYQAYVHDGPTPIIGATVEIYDKDNTPIDSLTTGMDGKTAIITLTQYTNTSSGMIYSTPYTINVTEPGFLTDTHIVDLTTNIIEGNQDDFLLQPSCYNATGCSSEGMFCGLDDMLYECNLGGDGCFERTNHSICLYGCSGGQCNCVNDTGCDAVGFFCDLDDMRYECILGGDSCLDRINYSICSAGCSGGECNPEYIISIDSCRQLNQADKIYLLTEDLTGAEVVSSGNGCFSIAAQNITLDCQGYTISNDIFSGTGIFSDYDYTTINNCVVNLNVDLSSAVLFVDNAFNAITNSTFSDNYIAVELQSSHDNEITTNNLLSNMAGFFITTSSGSRIYNNNINSNSYGIYVNGGFNNISANDICSNTQMDVYCSEDQDFIDNACTGSCDADSCTNSC